jgi:HAD superfamily hydrolase (TIGR01490 family)
MSRPFAAFDIDGTILRWQLYHAVNDALVKQGSIDRAAFEKVRAARMSWKRRSGEDSFRDYENELVKVFDAALADLPVAHFQTAVDIVFAEYKDQVYTYTRNLIQELKDKDYLLFAISGSPAMIVQKFADYYGFDDCVGTDYPTKDGRFTGTKQLSLGKKPVLLRQLIDKHGATHKSSLAIGDSEGDIDMLAMVERPIAFNPTKKLFEHARQQGWQVVVERKNMVYELEPGDGSYLVA